MINIIFQLTSVRENGDEEAGKCKRRNTTDVLFLLLHATVLMLLVSEI